MSNFRFEVWPTEQKIITQHFGARPGYYAQFGLPGHEGLDFAAPPDSRVFCVAPGVVRRVLSDGGPYGINVRVAHPDGYETIYAHLKQAEVTEGQELQAGDVVGLAGMTGNTDGPHLHLTLKNHNGAQVGYPNNIVDPTPFIRHLLDPNRDEAQYIRDTVPDGTVLQPGVEFAQTWFLRNSGTTTWGMGYTLRLVSGDALGAPPQVTVPPAPPNAEVPVSVSFRTPTTPGRHRSTWRLADPEGNLFGPPVWVEVVVPETSVTTPTTPTGPFVQRRGNEFFVNGRPFRFIGVNMRGLIHYGQRQSDPLRFSRPEHRASQLEAAQNMGARVVRLFVPDRDASADEIEQRFREVVELVKSRFPQLYLLPAFTNLYGDVPFHVPGDESFYAPPPSGGGNLLNREFYAEGYRRNYLPLVQRIVSAFRNEPAIFAWEIGNELKLDRGNLGDPNDPNPRLFINFNLAVAAAIKQIDPSHLVTTGMKSTHHAWLHTAELQEALYASPNIDFITIHSYEGIYDQEGDRRVYEDVAVAARLNKPFIVEEAGFDRRLFPDRTPKYQEHADRWYGLGARGYMPWGFIHAPEIGDGDNDVGVGANLDDFGALRSLFQGLAARVAAGTGAFAGLLPGPGAFGGLVGFDFRRYNQTYLAHDDPAPLNEAAAYEVQVEQADAPDEAPAWRVIGIHHLTPEENSGKHHVYVEALDEQGQRVREPGLRLEWGWEGQRADEAAPPVAFDKGEMEPATNVPIERGQRLWVRIGGDLPSDKVMNLHANHPDEAAADGSTGNSIGHHSYYVVFQRGTRAGVVRVDAAAYVPGSDAVPDLSTLRPGTRFTQRWTLRNTGTTAWRSPGYKLVWTGHKSLDAPPQVAVPECAPGEEVQVEVEQVAPTEAGVHLSTWQMSNPQDELFGDRVWTLIQVESQPAATLTPLRPLGAALAGPAALPAPTLPPPGSGELDPELLPAWRKHIEQQLNNNQTMFQQILQGFMNPYWTTVWLYRILFGLGVAAFIVAAALAFSGRSGWTAALFGGISLASVLGFFLVRPLQALEENLQFITWLGLIYNTYWVHLTYANDPATVHEDVDKAADDAIAGIQKLMAKHEAAAAKRPWLRA